MQDGINHPEWERDKAHFFRPKSGTYESTSGSSLERYEVFRPEGEE